jgi:glutathione synthase/RimK-type ligase-like ATP-grasp enzyme
VVVVRSTWDYSDRRGEFLDWCARPRKLLNLPAVIAWNTDKTYLRELAVAGIPTVPTTWVAPGPDRAIPDLPGGHMVVKPSVSAGARNTARYGPGDEDRIRTHVDRLVNAGLTVMLQPYVSSVDDIGEIGIIFIDGVLSHSIRKGPLLRTREVATHLLWAPEDISVRLPTPEERAVAEATLDTLRWGRDELLYARVDLVQGDDGRPMLLELELAEPSLFLGFGARAAQRLASGVARRLNDAT